MAFTYPRPHAEVWVPDASPLAEALARTTDLGVVAHQDDLEFAALAPIAACLDDPERWFTGVACTDGAGSARSGRFADCSDEEMRVVRREEQRAAAEIGGYSAIFQLGHASASIRGDGHGRLVDELVEILAAARPVNVYTHNLADKHSTHLAAAVATIEAVRRLPADQRPWRVVGVEGWRSLDWLSDDEKILLDVSGHRDLAAPAGRGVRQPDRGRQALRPGRGGAAPGQRHPARAPGGRRGRGVVAGHGPDAAGPQRRARPGRRTSPRPSTGSGPT